MNTNRSTFTAILLCIIFYLGYTKYLESKYPNLRQRKPATATAPVEKKTEAEEKNNLAAPTDGKPTESSASKAMLDTPKVSMLTPDELSLKNNDLAVSFNQDESAFTSVRALKYFVSQDPGAATVELLDFPLTIQGLTGEPSERNQGYSGRREGDSIVFSRTDAKGWLIEQRFTMPSEGYVVHITTTYTNTTDKPMALVSKLAVDEAITSIDGGGLLFPSAMYEPRHWSAFIAHIGGSAERFATQSYCEPDEIIETAEVIDEQQNEQIKFFGLENRYFLRVFMPEAKRFSYKMTRASNSPTSGCNLTVLATLDQGTIAPGQSAEIKMKAFFGPKDISLLEKVDPDLKTGVNLGWFSIIAYPLLSLLNVFFALTNNYGWAIIIVTILLKIVFYPLTKQAAVSAHHMKKLQPEMKKLQEKYKDDRQKMQLELMNLYKVHKVNPAKSCLPILPTIPVFIAFYNVLMYAYELRQAPFGLWIHDLSAADPYFITPVLLGVFMLIQMKLTPNIGMDKTQQRIMMAMPVIFTFAMVSLPAGLVLYMLANSILTIIQQQWLNKKLAHI